jgi:hypothetical protein
MTRTAAIAARCALRERARTVSVWSALPTRTRACSNVLTFQPTQRIVAPARRFAIPDFAKTVFARRLVLPAGYSAVPTLLCTTNSISSVPTFHRTRITAEIAIPSASPGSAKMVFARTQQ